MFARITAAAVLTFCSSLAPAQATSPSDSMFRGDLAHSGVYPGPAPKSIDHVVWQFKTFGHVVSSPVAANGMVYIGSDDHFVYAIDALKGTAAWKFGTDAAVRSTPAVAGGSVFVLSLDGNLYALDARSGKLQWKFATGGESRMSAPGLYEMQPALEVMPDVWDFFLSSPAVDNGTVYFGSGDHHVYAVDALTGRLRWKFLAGDVVHSSPAIADGTLYIGCWDGLLYALNSHTGQLLWKFVSGADPTRFMQGIPGSAAVASGIVVFGSRDNFIYALDSRSGKQLWRQSNHNSWVIASPAIRDNVVYITTSDSMLFRALDLQTGNPRFDVPFLAYSFSSPAIASGHAYFGSFDGKFYDIDLSSHKIASQFQVQDGRRFPILLTPDGHLNTGVIFGPNGPDGKPNNTIDANVISIDRLLHLGGILSSPSVLNGVVFVASADGSVYALD